MNQLSDTTQRKFIDTINLNDWEIETDSGWEDVKRLGKTVPYRVWELETTSFALKAADTHIIFDNKMNEVFVKDVNVGDLIMTKNGPEAVCHIEESTEIVNMYDFELEDGNRRYYTNGILSHNTLWLCHIATALMKLGYSVLYVSCEMSEEMIGQRLDANLLNYIMEELGKELPKKEYLTRVRTLYEKTEGKLKIKGYPNGTANANHLRAFLNELKLKEDFIPDVIIGDYLNIFASSRLPASAMMNSYLYVKAITEEMRGIADEFNCPFVTATQTNRGGAAKGKDTDMDDISDSFGLPMTADWMGAIIQNEELFAMQKYLLKCIKSRFADNIHKIYTMGVDRSHMKLMDLPEHEQELPLHIKDQLRVAAQSSAKLTDAEAVETLLEQFDFKE